MDTIILSKRLKELRQNLNITQKEFAKTLNITAAALSKYESGNGYPSIPILTEIAEKYNVSVDWLLGLSDKPTNKSSIETYADLIKFLVDISKTDMDIEIQEVEYEYPEFDEPVKHCCGILFNTKNKDFERFFEDYNKMKELYKDKSIDEEVYNLWLEKTINKFKDIVINDCEDLPF